MIFLFAISACGRESSPEGRSIIRDKQIVEQLDSLKRQNHVLLDSIGALNKRIEKLERIRWYGNSHKSIDILAERMPTVWMKTNFYNLFQSTRESFIRSVDYTGTRRLIEKIYFRKSCFSYGVLLMISGGSQKSAHLSIALLLIPLLQHLGLIEKMW